MKTFISILFAFVIILALGVTVDLAKAENPCGANPCATKPSSFDSYSYRPTTGR